MSPEISLIEQINALTRALTEERHESFRQKERLEHAYMILTAQEQEIHDLEMRLAA